MVRDLTHPFIAARPNNGLQKSIQLKMGLILGTKIAQQAECGKRKRCRDCMEQVAGKGQKKKKDALKKVSTICNMCKNFICKDHARIEYACAACSDIENEYIYIIKKTRIYGRSV